MPPSPKTRIVLWARSAGRCALENCRRELIVDATNLDDDSLVGEVAHVVAEEDNGPRGDPSMPLDQRNASENLILLCRIHHKLVDDQINTYTVEVLTNLRRQHFEWVKTALTPEAIELQRARVVYADLFDTWARLSHLDSWEIWTSWLLSNGQPSLSRDVHEDLERLRAWLFARHWPGRFAEVDEALKNFFRVLRDLLETFARHMELRGDRLWTKKFYQIPERNRKRYDELGAEFDYHVDLVQDLTCELTRAGNLVCAQIQRHLDSALRRSEGVLTILSGPTEELKFERFRPEYRAGERYDTLEAFYAARVTRDVHFGAPVPMPSQTLVLPSPE